MTIKELANKPGFKLFMSRLYGWGASLVIAGALFKILHWKGANEMLMVGMGTEALIFFLSAFENAPPAYKWERAYPGILDAHEVDGDDISWYYKSTGFEKAVSCPLQSA